MFTPSSMQDEADSPPHPSNADNKADDNVADDDAADDDADINAEDNTALQTTTQTIMLVRRRNISKVSALLVYGGVHSSPQQPGNRRGNGTTSWTRGTGGHGAMRGNGAMRGRGAGRWEAAV
jgi:hypothetical protein